MPQQNTGESPQTASRDDKFSKRRILISASMPGETRLAITEGSQLANFWVEREDSPEYRNSIFKGRISAIRAGLSAAFVTIGLEKDGFLPLRETGGKEDGEAGKSAGTGKADGSAQAKEQLQEGDELLVQLVHEQPGTGKGALLQRSINLPGRLLILFPAGGSFRRVASQVAPSRRQMVTEMLDELNVPDDCGIILRTFAAQAPVKAIQQELDELWRLWDRVQKQAEVCTAPRLMLLDGDLVTRAVHNYLTPTIDKVVIDSEAEYEARRKQWPEHLDRLELHSGSVPLFRKYKIEQQVEALYSRKLPLQSGGEIVIERTEAMTTVDVNIKKSDQKKSPEALKKTTNLEAVREVARQLVLRGIGGLVVIDFIDMASPDDRREVEDAMDAARKRDAAYVVRTDISALGLMELSRQRMAGELMRLGSAPCSHCSGSGWVTEQQAEALNSRKLPLQSGGEIVIDRTEAMTAVDVNTKSVDQKESPEALKKTTNLEAVREVARQLVLRDIGGLVVIDLIDMASSDDRKEVESAMDAALEQDAARMERTDISELGLMELSRQSMAAEQMQLSSTPCSHCDGNGWVRAPQDKASKRRVKPALDRQAANAPESEVIEVAPDQVRLISGRRGHTVQALQWETGTKIEVGSTGQVTVHGETPEALASAIKQIRSIIAIAAGNIYHGKVVERIGGFGARINILPGVDGMVRLSEIAYQPVHTVGDYLSEGQEVDVKVLDIDEKGRINLSIKALALPVAVGDIIRVKVTRIADFGALVNILPGVDGLVHISEIAHEHVTAVGDYLNEGQEVDVKVLDIDEKDRISLSIKALTDARVAVGDVYHGKVESVEHFGAFVNILPGVDGLVHISEIVHGHVYAVRDYLNEGQEVDVKVLNIDEKGIHLSIKALTA